MAEVAKRVWTRDEINHLLQTSEQAVAKAMVRLFELQTLDEQRSKETQHLNERGFSAAYARKGTYYAYLVNKGYRLGDHLPKARTIALLHSKQLVEIANR